MKQLLIVMGLASVMGAQALVFTPMPPCRVVDTRASQGYPAAYGPPSLAANATRAFAIRSSANCTIPSGALAYSLNVTVVPSGPLGYITLWPVGTGQPTVSTLNDLTGMVLANAAIVPAGNDTGGSVNVFSNGATDLIIDINGYFVAAPTGGGGGTPINFMIQDPACTAWVIGTLPYNLTNTPKPSTSLALYLNGVRQTQGVDYTLSGNAVTWTASQPSGIIPGVGAADNFVCDYQY